MGLFDVFKKNDAAPKEKKTHICCNCGKEFSGFLKGLKMVDGNYVCAECFPIETPLMKVKGACASDFDVSKLEATGMRTYIAHQKEIQQRQKEFRVTHQFHQGQLLFDENHKWFKIKEYDEVFSVEFIKYFNFSYEKDGGYFNVIPGFILDDMVYANIVYAFRHKIPFLTSDKKVAQELLDEFYDIHALICPKAKTLIN